MEACRALSMSYGQGMRLIVIPQGIRRVLPALVNQLKKEAPRFAHVFPELPRLLHEVLKQRAARNGGDAAAIKALLSEQRRTNGLLQALLYCVLGFTAGLLAAQVLLHNGTF